jgi:hypothetical protein
MGMPKTVEQRVDDDIKQCQIARVKERLQEEYKRHIHTAATDQNANDRKNAREQAIVARKQLDKLEDQPNE